MRWIAGAAVFVGAMSAWWWMRRRPMSVDVGAVSANWIAEHRAGQEWDQS